MDLKLLEDLAVLARERSFVRAAAERHVTHPAFGRRIRALEAWAGVPLVERKRGPVQLTPAGATLLQQSQALLDGLMLTRDQLRSSHGLAVGEVLRIGTGRTLARTLVADWLAKLCRPRQMLHGQRVEVLTGSLTEIAVMMERGDVDLIFCYEHPATSMRLSSQRFRHLTVAQDKLVPVSRTDGRGEAVHGLNDGAMIVYHPAMSLGALMAEHLRHAMPDIAARTHLVCDSADAMHELVLRGLGAAWLPWSLVAADCKRNVLAPLGGRGDTVQYQVRMYRPRARQSALFESIWNASDG